MTARTRRSRCRIGRLSWLAPWFLLICAHSAAQAQINNEAFGIGSRITAAEDAVRSAIVAAVSQGIGTLPPNAGQSFVYEFDPALQTFVRSSFLGPTAFRSPLPIGAGRMSIRVAGTYFDLSERLGPIDYEVTGLGEPVFTRFGLGVSAQVGIVNVAYSYGVLDWLELDLNVPVTVVSAQATASFLSLGADADAPIGDALVAAATSIEAIDRNLENGTLLIRSGTARQLGVPFNDETSIGLGRVSLGAKAALPSIASLDWALSLEGYLPSPSQDEFAGPDSGALLPRLIMALELWRTARMHADIGYQYDTELDELSGTLWNAGASYAIRGATLDAGVGGAIYQKGIEWTPSSFTQPPGAAIDVPLELTALRETRLGTDYVDFLAGIKVQVTDGVVVSGAVSVPLNDTGIRPAASGTIAVEYAF